MIESCNMDTHASSDALVWERYTLLIADGAAIAKMTHGSIRS